MVDPRLHRLQGVLAAESAIGISLPYSERLGRQQDWVKAANGAYRRVLAGEMSPSAAAQVLRQP